MKAELLQYLQQADGFLSGQELCEHFGVSRTAVWKAVRSLRTDGFVIEAVKNRGYRLTEEPDILTKESCGSELQTAWIGRYLEAYQEIDSTNRRAKQLGEEHAPDGSVVTADLQTAGKGRRGRSWMTPAGTALAFSLLLYPSCPPGRASMLTLVAALAVSRALDETAQIRTQIKWPNDIVCGGKKLCGILTEMSTELDAIHYVVVGIGINIHTAEFPPELAGKAVSLMQITGKQFRRSRILSLVLRYFEEYYEKFCADWDLCGLRPEYEAKLAGKDAEVCLIENGRERRGISRGITGYGALRVEYPDGSIEEVISGEVSVRGIYGYV